MPLEVPSTIQSALHYERSPHPGPLVQRRREALWVRSQGLPPGQLAQLVGMTENPRRAYCQLSLAGGGEGLKAVAIQGPGSARQAHSPALEASFHAPPPATLTEAHPAL